MTDGKVPARLRWLALFFALMFAALTTRLWFMQVLASAQYNQLAKQNGIRIVQTDAPRGRIYDRNGNLVVGNRASLTILVRREALGSHEEAVLFRLHKLLGIPVKALVSRINDPRYFVYTPVPVASDVPKSVAFQIAEHPKLYPGVSYALLPVRTYPDGDLAAQVLGYTGEISASELKSSEFKGYAQGDIVGQTGVEATYERWLHGEKGDQKYKVNSSGRNLGPIGSAKQPVPGDDVVLSIDTHIQRLAEHSLQLGMQAARGTVDTTTGRTYAANAGAVVVMDPHTGQVLAMASSPTYDPRVAIDGFSTKEWNSLNSPSSGYPLLNRAIGSGITAYPPGSTFKPFVALSALHRGIASTTGSYNCPAQYTVPGDTSHTVYNNWSPVDLGYMNLSQALTVSCDTVFYGFGYQDWVSYAQSGPGTSSSALVDYKGRKTWLQDDLRSFGFGSPTGVDLPSEYGGRIPDPRWKAEIHKQNPTAFPCLGPSRPCPWLPGDYINMSIGQGDTLVTPLQLADAYSAIANGGTVWVPHVGLEVRRPGGHVVKQIRPKRGGRLPFSKTDLAFIRQALTNVPETGTAAPSFVGFPFSQVPVAGKTGTAEVAPHQPDSWFAAMAPAYNPKYVVVCLVEQGGHGSTTAAPIVRSILEGLFHLPKTPFSLGNVAD
jgi:penicillin-binding protein 2